MRLRTRKLTRRPYYNTAEALCPADDFRTAENMNSTYAARSLTYDLCADDLYLLYVRADSRHYSRARLLREVKKLGRRYVRYQDECAAEADKWCDAAVSIQGG